MRTALITPCPGWSVCRRRSLERGITNPRTAGWRNGSPNEWKKYAGSKRRRGESPNLDYEVRRLHSWGEFLDVITDSPYSDWAFRGSRHENWPLESAISRYLRTFRVDPRRWPAQEERILRIFKRKAHHFLDDAPPPDDDFEWMAP